ncbi:MAG: PEP-CTERM sorting domain-containing protein [Bryobacteraceae bacterium]
MKRFAITLCALLLVGAASPPAAADDVELFDYAFNLQGGYTLNATPVLPAGMAMDDSGFDYLTGLGTLTIQAFNPGSVLAILGLNIDITNYNSDPPNLYSDEYGSVNGAAPAGLSYEIDEPGYTIGHLFDDVAAGTLHNLNAITPANVDDVAMALGWGFTLPAAHKATMTFVVSTSAPSSGFYLGQHDPVGPDVYFSSNLNITPTGGGVVPEPSSWILLATVAGALGWRRLRKA